MTLPLRTTDLRADDRVCVHVTVPLARAAAFEKFRHDFHAWWPSEFTWSGDAVEDMFFEGRKGGMVWERGPEGHRLDMARVMRWVPPEKIVLRWHVGPEHMPQPNPDRASEVEIRFVELAGATRVELEHSEFSRHGKGGREYRNIMATQWPYILKRYAEHCGGRELPDSAVPPVQPALHSVPALV